MASALLRPSSCTMVNGANLQVPKQINFLFWIIPNLYETKFSLISLCWVKIPAFLGSMDLGLLGVSWYGFRLSARQCNFPHLDRSSFRWVNDLSQINDWRYIDVYSYLGHERGRSRLLTTPVSNGTRYLEASSCKRFWSCSNLGLKLGILWQTDWTASSGISFRWLGKIWCIRFEPKLPHIKAFKHILIAVFKCNFTSTNWISPKTNEISGDPRKAYLPMESRLLL